VRTIEISTDVFSMIWGLRADGEETEDDILRRVLKRNASSASTQPASKPAAAPTSEKRRSEVLWRDDIVAGLKRLGGEADLSEIYRVVTDIRKSEGRSLPASTDAVIRRELENNSSDSESFTAQRDLFRSVNGIGAGRWALRSV
jgi:hypothetical protein